MLGLIIGVVLVVVIVLVIIGIYNGLIGHIDKQTPAKAVLGGESGPMLWDG